MFAEGRRALKANVTTRYRKTVIRKSRYSLLKTSLS
jgi:hypothetical protein